jgi:hypothetical protein
MEIGALKVYYVEYQVYGQDGSLLSEDNTTVIAGDAIDASIHVHDLLIGKEINVTGDNGKFFHAVAEGVSIENCELVAMPEMVTAKATEYLQVCHDATKAAEAADADEEYDTKTAAADIPQVNEQENSSPEEDGSDNQNNDPQPL